MITYKPDTFVRHRSKAEWGLGRIVAVDADFVRVRFQSEAEEKRFPIGRAESFLDPVSEGEVSEDARAATSDKRKVAGAKARTTATGTKCGACGGALKRSRYSRDGKWKVCPRCSQLHGEHHAYRRCPEAFGTTTERETPENTDGVQSHCYTCRQNQAPSFVGDDVRLCADLETQTKKP